MALKSAGVVVEVDLCPVGHPTHFIPESYIPRYPLSKISTTEAIFYISCDPDIPYSQFTQGARHMKPSRREPNTCLTSTSV